MNVINYVLFAILIKYSITICYSPSNVNCSPSICYNNGSFHNDCVSGFIFDDFMNVTITCVCKCSNKWANKLNYTCDVPRRHKLACRFGGPRWYFNCWNNNSSVEMLYTQFEETVSNNLPAHVVVDFRKHVFNFTKL